jgi:cystathionine beta-lyase/cystathionine gamma-synthase
MTYELQDLKACAELAKKHGIVTIIDNSYCSPIYQKPAEFGIDIVVHSGTKYLNGHSDVVIGVLCGAKAMVKKIFESELMTLGGIVSPHDASLVIRGLRTLPLRLKQSDEGAKYIINKLDGHPNVEKIWYPFHDSFPQKELAMRQMKGCGGLFSVQFKCDSMEKMEAFIHRVQRFLMAVSWGGHESLMIPTIGFYNIPGRSNSPLPWTFVRFYIGLEDPEWLWEDLEAAMEELTP